MHSELLFELCFFICFSSAFNTIQPLILVRKLLDMNVSSSYVSWIFGYLTNRCQYVSLDGTRSPTAHTNTSAHQDTVPAPFLNTLYTSSYTSTDNVYPLVKYADDSVVVGTVNNDDDSGYLREINDFVQWCDDNIYLQLNVTKTKELCNNFSRKQTREFYMTLQWPIYLTYNDR